MEKSNPQPVERHPFEPFLPTGARMLFLGSFPPQPHRWCMPFYYPNWINDFWRIMGLIHFGDKDHFCDLSAKRFDEDAIRAFCSREGLAFYDTACQVRRLKDNASDAFLEVVMPTDIPALLARIPACGSLITTGEKATGVIAERFGCGIPPIGGSIEIHVPMPEMSAATASTRLPDTSAATASNRLPDMTTVAQSPRPIRFWRMPSTSRAYPLPLEKKAEFYRRLF